MPLSRLLAGGRVIIGQLQANSINMRPTSFLAVFLLSRDLADTTYSYSTTPTNTFKRSALHSTFRQSLTTLQDAKDEKYNPPDFTVIKDDNDNDDGYSDFVGKDEYIVAGIEEEAAKEKSEKKSKKRTKKDLSSRTKAKSNPNMQGTSWMQKNAVFLDEDYGEPEDDGAEARPKRSRSFREDFRGTRVFVKNIPERITWQDLKDHFGSIDGQEVVFASVSVDPVTGESKGVGIVQFETNEMAQNAIRVMRNYPLDGSNLYVREDVQEREGAQLKSRMPSPNRRDSPPSQWRCADDENAQILSDAESEAVLSLIKDRDAARRKRNYDVSDQIREELKAKFGVHIDDRLTQWWVSFDGSHVPQSIKAVKGEGRWGGRNAWRQIPTTPENDACVNPDLVNGLLAQRDIARREKDFSTADALLEQARNAPDGDLYLRIHDESRTWRIWTDEPPSRLRSHSETRKTAAEQCIDLVREKAPHKEEEIRALLAKFPGREYPILKKLKKSLNDL